MDKHVNQLINNTYLINLFAALPLLLFIIKESVFCALFNSPSTMIRGIFGP